MENFKLVIDDKSLESGTLQVRWCVSPLLLEDLKSRGIIKPHILLVARGQNGAEDRRVVPMDQMADFIQFKAPGKNKILAAVMKNREIKNTQRIYLRREEGEYRTHVYYPGRGSGSEEFYKDSFVDFAELEVVVPAGVFAKEPPKWEKWWVNYFFSQPPRDQCAYRRRRLFAYSLQPMIFPIIAAVVFAYSVCNILIRLITVIALLIGGAWDISGKPLIHPLSQSRNDIYRDVSSKKNLWRRAFLRIFFIDLEEERRKEEEKSLQREKELQEAFDARYGILSCDNLGKSPLSLLPASRTIHLRFEGLKAKVCRPFAK